jgi:hypothetical protein
MDKDNRWTTGENHEIGFVDVTANRYVEPPYRSGWTI